MKWGKMRSSHGEGAGGEPLSWEAPSWPLFPFAVTLSEVGTQGEGGIHFSGLGRCLGDWLPAEELGANIGQRPEGKVHVQGLRPASPLLADSQLLWVTPIPSHVSPLPLCCRGSVPLQTSGSCRMPEKSPQPLPVTDKL